MNVQPHFERIAERISDAPPQRRRWLIVGALVGLALIALLGWRLLHSGPPPAPVELPHISVIVPGRQLATNRISATGSLAARRELPVGVAGEGGRIAQVMVDPGNWVGAGQVLALIDRSVQSEQANQLSAQIRAAQADADLAEAQLERAQKLVSRGFISKADIDQKTATRDAARARVSVARAQLGEVHARIGQLIVRAPAAGLVLERNTDPGQVVGSGTAPLFRLAKGGEMELRAQVAEQDMAKLSVGMPATVTPIGATKSFTGSIWLLSPTIDRTTRQGQARIALKYDPALRPGGFASAQIVSGNTTAPVLPESAIQTDDRGSFVLLVDRDNKVIRQAVTTGAVTDHGIPVLNGLHGNERVVLSAGAFLNPGEKVIPELVRPGRD
jgi:RND family efflux transporter MFP subunit